MGDIREKIGKTRETDAETGAACPSQVRIQTAIAHSPRESLHFAATVGVAGASERLSDRQSSQNIAIIEPGR